MDKEYKCPFCSEEFNRLRKDWCDKHCGNVQQAIKVLKDHQAWRKGADIPMQNPADISTALIMVNELFSDG
jgi:hypothetical protein